MRFTQSHEWVCDVGDDVVVGITEYARRELGEVVYVELPVVGSVVKAGQEVAVLESTKAAADVYAPVSGEIVEINSALCDFVNHINTSAQGAGWLFKIRMTDPSELNNLLDEQKYLALVGPSSAPHPNANRSCT